MASEPHSQVQDLVNQIAESAVPPVHAMSVRGARQGLSGILETEEDPVSVGEVRDLEIPGPDSPLTIRVYTPEGDGPFPALVYFHGGGWVRGNLDTADRICRELSTRADCVVVSVAYRRAPEHKFPAAVEDCYAATQWVADYAEYINVDPDRIGVGGASAGGNLAAVIALMARDRGSPSLVYQLLLFPVTTLVEDDRVSGSLKASKDNFLNPYWSTWEETKWYRDQFLRNEIDAHNPYASPLLAPDLSGVPPAFILTAGFDSVRDDGKAYADRLQDEGVDVEYVNYDDMIHGFIAFPQFDRAEEGYQDIARGLRSAFSE